MNKEINPTETLRKFNACFSCQAQFTAKGLQAKKYHLFKLSLQTELLVMLFHKNCWTKFKKGWQKAWQQIQADPIYQWSMGKTKEYEN